MRACTAALAAALGLASGASGSEEAVEARYIRRFFPDPTEWESREHEPTRTEVGSMELWEVSQYPPGAQPTREQQEAADGLIERGERAVQKHGWEDFQKAVADGFKSHPNDGRHYFNAKYVFDDRVLDPERPEFLMYYDTPQGKRLVGFMFYVAEPTDRGPQIGGPLTVWHYHLFPKAVCMLGMLRGPDRRGQGLLPGAEADERGRCAWGIPFHRGPEMLHLWLIRHPLGPFGTRMYIPPENVKEELEKRDRTREEKAGELIPAPPIPLDPLSRSGHPPHTAGGATVDE
jgi:hypothetical protein